MNKMQAKKPMKRNFDVVVRLFLPLANQVIDWRTACQVDKSWLFINAAVAQHNWHTSAIGTPPVFFFIFLFFFQYNCYHISTRRNRAVVTLLFARCKGHDGKLWNTLIGFTLARRQTWACYVTAVFVANRHRRVTWTTYDSARLVRAKNSNMESSHHTPYSQFGSERNRPYLRLNRSIQIDLIQYLIVYSVVPNRKWVWDMTPNCLGRKFCIILSKTSFRIVLMLIC